MKELENKVNEVTELADAQESQRIQSILKDRLETVRAFKTRMATSTQTSAPVKDSCQTPEAVEDSGDDSVTTTCGDDDARSYLNSMDDSWEDSEIHFLKKTEYFDISGPEYSDDILDALLAQLDDDIGINGPDRVG